MTEFMTMRLPVEPDAVAPDGSHVRILLSVNGGGMAHFELGPQETSVAVAHRTVEEVWFFLSRGEMWRKLENREEIVPVDSGTSISIPVGTHFQFRSFGVEPLAAVAITTPPWPGQGEAYIVEGTWVPTVDAGPV